MSSPDPGCPDRVLFAAGTASYDNPDFQPLAEISQSLRTVVRSLQEMGFTVLAGARGYRLNPTVETLRNSLKDAASAAPVVVCYYTGHGAKPEGDIYYLVGKKSRPADLAGTALAARDLPRLLMRVTSAGARSAGQPSVLLILDCCFAGSGGVDILADALRDLGNPNLWVIASAGTVQWAQEGLFAKAFCRALREPRTGDEQPFVSMEDIADQVRKAIDEATGSQKGQEARFFGPATGITGTPPFFPNPKRRPVRGGALTGVQPPVSLIRPWASLVQGGPAGHASGSYVTGKTGRVRAASDLAGFVKRSGRSGLAIITGGPGTGKSTQLALPLLLTQRSWREELLSSAPPGSLIKHTADLLPEGMPIIAVHARGLNTDQAASAIAGALGSTSTTAAGLLEHLDAYPQHDRVVIVDAVDEARSPTTLFTGLLCPLARQPGVRVVAGARPHVLAGIPDVDLTIDLDTSDYQDPDALTEYVHRLLIASEEPDVPTPYKASQAETARTVARAIARRATARGTGSESFLFGGLLALEERDRAEPATSQAMPGNRNCLPA
jgi:Caspase domain